MPTLRECQTAVVARNEAWSGTVATETYEAGWAREMVIFLRLLECEGEPSEVDAAVQISPDGLHWVDEGSRLAFPQTVGEVTFVRLSHFGQYVRLRSELPDGLACKVIVTINSKA